MEFICDEREYLIYDKLYALKYKNDQVATIILSDKNHPVFKAHFPSNPILPGFMHFEIVSDIFGIEIETIKKAKFSKVVLPTQTLRYEKENNQFKVFCEDEEVVSFSL